jgi:hypothetical protein
MSSNVRSRYRRPRIESLEDRSLLAGTVAAFVSNGDLFIRGDNSANGVAIRQVDIGAYEVTGFALGGSATLINGSASPQVITGIVGDFNIDLFAGSDILVVSNDLVASMTLATELNGGVPVIIPPSLVIPDPSVDAVQTHVPRNMIVKMNGGDDGLGVNVEVGGGGDGGGWWADLSVGLDRVAIERSTIHNHLTLLAGAGADNARIVDSSITKAVRMFMENGNDEFAADGMSAGPTTVDMGAHTDLMARVVNSSTTGELLMIGDSGNDRFEINEFVGSRVSILAGLGSDTINVGAATITTNLSIDGLDGHDTVTLGTAFGLSGPLNVGGNLWADLGLGQDVLLAGDVTVGKSSIITGSVGIDRVDLTAFSVDDDLTIDTGDGSDQVTLDDVDVVDNWFAFLGAGNDTLSVGASSAAVAILRGGANFDVFNDNGGNAFGLLDIAEFEDTNP